MTRVLLEKTNYLFRIDLLFLIHTNLFTREYLQEMLVLLIICKNRCCRMSIGDIKMEQYILELKRNKRDMGKVDIHSRMDLITKDNGDKDICRDMECCIFQMARYNIKGNG